MQFPRIIGNVRVTQEGQTTVISGDPEGLRALGKLMIWLAEADQSKWPYLPDGGRAHIHLYPKHDFSPDSCPAELQRMDPKAPANPPEQRTSG